MKVAFLSSRGRGMTPDLLLLQKYLSSQSDAIEFQYFLRKELVKDQKKKEDILLHKQQACARMEHVISADLSYKGPLPELPEDGIAVLIAAAYDYFFKIALEGDAANRKKSSDFDRFHFAFASSPLVKRALCQGYLLEEMREIFEVCSPFGADLSREAKRDRILARTADNYPFVKDRKVLAVITGGKSGENTVDCRGLVDRLGRDWCLITNDLHFLESVSDCHWGDRIPVVYTGKYMPAGRALYLADVLVTNSGYYASSFLTTGKALFPLAYNENWFERYMKRTYPDLFLEDLGEACQDRVSPDLLKMQQSLRKDLSYPPVPEPEDKLIKLLRKTPGVSSQSFSLETGQEGAAQLAGNRPGGYD